MELKYLPLIPLICVGIIGGCSAPKDAILIGQFRQRKPAFERIAQMAQEDKLEGDLLQAKEHGLLSASRLSEYKQLFDQAGVTGVMRIHGGTKKEQILFSTKPPIAKEEKGFVYSQEALPTVKSLDNDSPMPDVPYYMRIEGNWYLEYEHNS